MTDDINDDDITENNERGEDMNDDEIHNNNNTISHFPILMNILSRHFQESLTKYTQISFEQ